MNSKLRKLIECYFLILVLSAFLIPYSSVLGESAVSPQMKTEALLAIIGRANETVVEICGDLRARGFQVPQEAIILYDEGIAKAVEAFSLYNSGSYEEASRTAVEALKKFKECVEIVYNQVEDPSTEIESVNEIVIRLNNSIARGFRYLNYIQNLVHILEAKGFDTSAIESKIQSAKGLLNYALRELHRHRFKSVRDTLLIVKGLLGSLMERFEMISFDLKVSRLDAYILNADKRLDLLEAKILSLSSELSSEAKNASLAALQDAENSLDNARNYLEAQMVGEVVNELVQSRESEKEALRIIGENQTSTSGTSDLATNSSY